MLLNILVLLIIVGYYVLLALGGKEPNMPANYLLKKCILVETILLLLVVLLSINELVDSENYSNGFEIPFESIDAVFIGFVVPPIIGLLSLFIKKLKRSNIINDLNFPIKLIPKTKKGYYLFFIFIIGGVIYEEIVMRYYLFHYLNKLLHLDGDWLILSGTCILGLGHIYQNTKGILLATLVHLILGKLYLSTDSIMYTIILHFLVDSNLLIEVYALTLPKRNEFISDS